MIAERVTIAILAKSLGYCCEWAFAALYGNAPTCLLVARLGVTRQAVVARKAFWRRGQCKCEEASSCLRKDLPKLFKTSNITGWPPKKEMKHERPRS